MDPYWRETGLNYSVTDREKVYGALMQIAPTA